MLVRELSVETGVCLSLQKYFIVVNMQKYENYINIILPNIFYSLLCL